MLKLLGDFVDLVFPHTCLGCNKPYVGGEEHLCSSCELDLPFFDGQQQLENIFAGRIPVAEVNVFLKFYSKGLTQRILHEIKYRGNRAMGEYIGRKFILHGKKQNKFGEAEVIIPVPLHKKKLRQRGYNQSEIIANGMAELLNVPVINNSLIRTVQSSTQTRKSRGERWHNVEGIFQVTNDNLMGKKVLLVDDVLTTGATLEACGQALLDSGVKSISIAAVAIAM